MIDKSTQACGRGGTPSRSKSESESQSYEPEETANYVSLGRGSARVSPTRKTVRIARGRLCAARRSPVEWDAVKYQEGSDQVLRFGMHRGNTYLEILEVLL